MKVSVRELKNHLSAYLHRVEAGETIQVCRHKTLVADIVPVGGTGDVRIPGVVWNGRKPRGGRNRPVIPGRSVADMVLEERD
ncbi:MAG: prevent-host-death protein [Gammaproteobacteria bacterium]|nr:MAG: prevent-host-death protein [Gammaproteobacteria bacterium]